MSQLMTYSCAMTSCEEPPLKRARLSSDVIGSSFAYEESLLTLSDDVILIIFSYLDPVDLLSLTQTCKRLRSISTDKALWKKIDIRQHVMTLGSLKRFTYHIKTNTKFIAIKGPLGTTTGNDISVSKWFLNAVAKYAPNLSCLILENHVIDSTQVALEDFPPSLEQLEINNCYMKNLALSRSYFYRLEKSLPKLKRLDLSNNKWFVPHSLLALSKSETLEALILAGCDVSDCLPYASLAANFGFNNLKHLDLRQTCVSDIEVTCFNRTATLRHLYLSASEPELAEAQVTDYSITTFGGGGGRGDGHGHLDVRDGIIILQVGTYQRPVCHLETLVVTNYPGITDVTLRHAATSMFHLKYIDVTGTGCSEAGIIDFKKNRPDVQIIPDVVVA